MVKQLRELGVTVNTDVSALKSLLEEEKQACAAMAQQIGTIAEASATQEERLIALSTQVEEDLRERASREKHNDSLQLSGEQLARLQDQFNRHLDGSQKLHGETEESQQISLAALSQGL